MWYLPCKAKRHYLPNLSKQIHVSTAHRVDLPEDDYIYMVCKTGGLLRLLVVLIQSNVLKLVFGHLSRC